MPQLSLNSAPIAGHAKYQSTVPPLQASGTLVQKHIYVHVPPPGKLLVAHEEKRNASVVIRDCKCLYNFLCKLELEESHKQLIHPQPAHNKQYKIIFIKAPSSAQSYDVEELQQQITAAQQSGEKTMVYVLANQSNEPHQQVIHLPHIPRAQPSSEPEVQICSHVLLGI